MTCPRLATLGLALTTLLGPAAGGVLAASSHDHFRYQPDPDAPAQDQPLSFTPCVGGMAGIYPCDHVDLMSFLPKAQIGGGGSEIINDIWGWTDPVTGHEWALVGRSNGTAFVDVTDPVNPIYVGNLPSHTGSSSWRDIKTYAGYAYVVSDNNGAHGLQVFDLSQLRNVVTPPVTFSETAHYAGFGSAHNIAIDEDTGFAYAVGSNTCSGGAHMVSLANPTAPVFAGCDSGDGYTHDTECVVYHGPDADWAGHEVCFAANEDTLTIVDVTNKSAPLRISRTPYAGSGYTHQGWLTEDHAHFLLDDELDEEDFGHNTYTYIWDLADLDAPVLMGHFTHPVPAIDHNLYIKGNVAYETNYRSGLRLLDISQIASGTLSYLGYFDTYPSSDSAAFSGTWSNYPYFASGNVIVSSIGEGLFVVRPQVAPDFTLLVPQPELDACLPGAASTQVSLGSAGGYAGSVTLSTPGLPAGAAASFTPNPVAVPGGSQLDVTVSATPAGSYPFLVHGEDGALAHEANVTLHVADAAPNAAGLVAPPDGAVNQPVRPAFSWSAAGQATAYVLEIASDPDFAKIELQTPPLAATDYTPSIDLAPNLVHFWRVRAQNACGAGPDSEVWSLTTGPAVVPEVSVADSSALEDPPGGFRHPSSISFSLTLSAFTSQVVSVDYSTAAGTATSGVDFVPTSGTLSFPPNVTSQPVSVPILDDVIDEPDETLFLNLANPTGGVLVDAQAVGTILDQDPPPDLSVADPSVLEGNQGQHSLAFVPTLSLPSGKTITLDYATGGGTATAGSDYLAAAGSLTFPPGTTALPVDVPVLGDLLNEGDETLGLSLTNAVDVNLPLVPVTGTILDDDPVAASVHTELVHGSVVDGSLAADPGPTGHQELYRISVPPHASVEVVADALTGDVTPLLMDRVASDGTSVLESASGGSLRWENLGDAPAAAEGVRVVSGGCSADCDAGDRYRLRSLETTAAAPRFNNSATQVTVLLLQNTGDEALDGHAWFWDGAGALAGSQAFSLGPRATLALDTRSVPGVDGQSGSITVSHTGRYGVLAGKAVAVEPATGFSFDTPLVCRAR